MEVPQYPQRSIPLSNPGVSARAWLARSRGGAAMAACNGAEIISTAAMPLSEVILVPEDEVGKFAIRQNLTTDTINETKRFKTGWLAWMEAAHGITRSDLLAKVVITA